LGMPPGTPASARRGPRDRFENSACANSTPARSIPLNVTLCALFLVLLVPSIQGRTDPATGRVRILFLGEVAWTNDLFLGWLAAEPQFVFTRVPLDIEWISLKEAKRFARIYLPRRKDDLTGAYDVSVFEDFSPDVLPISILEWFEEAVYDGLGIALIEYVNWGGTNDIPKWMTLEFYHVWPAETVMNDVNAAQGRTYYKVLNEDGPLQLPGIEGTPMNRGHHGDMKPREGSTVEAQWRGRKTPAMVTSSYGVGNTLQLGHGWDNIPDEPRIHYPYLMDFIFNQMFYIADLAYPEDLELVHALRTMFVSYEDRRKATMAVLDFVEMFGANPSRPVDMLDDIEVRHLEASGLYLTQDFEAAREILTPLLGEFAEVDVELMRAKNRALFWVYLIEWLAVSATSMICAVILWTLMIRRRLYRAVSTTKAL